MNASQAVAYIHAAQYTGAKNGLENTRALLMKLHIPTTPVPAIHVAGTNGKGSVCAMLSSMLMVAGLKVGLYTSPFLQFYNERIRIDGIPVSDALLAETVTAVKDAADTLAAEEDIRPTAFELGTATAFSIFQREKVDIAVVEVGLGGRLDPTNVLTPLVSVITALGMDHMEYLGDTIEKIAAEKAGIIKEGIPVVLSPALPGVETVIRSFCQQNHAPLHALRPEQIRVKKADAYGSLADFDLPDGSMEDAAVPLPGVHQVTNALTALCVVEILEGFPVTREAMRQGLLQTRWPARLEWIQGAPRVLLDGAHNGHGMAALREYASAFLQGEKRVLLTGVLKEKMSPDMLRDMASIAPMAVTVTPDNHRALEGTELADMLQAARCEAVPAQSLLEGLEKAKALAGPAGVIIAAGSLYLAGALRSLLGVTDEAL